MSMPISAVEYFKDYSKENQIFLTKDKIALVHGTDESGQWKRRMVGGVDCGHKQS